MKNVIFAAIIVVFVSGCVSNAGPYVTNISSDGNNGIIVEKCMVRFNSFNNGSVSTGECTSSTIKLRSN